MGVEADRLRSFSGAWGSTFGEGKEERFDEDEGEGGFYDAYDDGDGHGDVNIRDMHSGGGRSEERRWATTMSSSTLPSDEVWEQGREYQ